MKVLFATTLLFATTAFHAAPVASHAEPGAKNESASPMQSDVQVASARRSRPGANDPLTVTPGQAQAVERGLAWLAENQAANGSWRSKIGYKLNEDYSYQREEGHVGVTSLACMAFLAGGHLPGRGEYGQVVDRGLDFVLSCVHEDTRSRRCFWPRSMA